MTEQKIKKVKKAGIYKQTDYKKPPMPFIALTILWIIGIAIGKFFRPDIVLVSVFFIILFLLFFFKKIRVPALLLLTITTGVIRFISTNYLPDNSLHNILENKKIINQHIEAQVISEIKVNENSYSFQAKILTIDTYPVKGKVTFLSDNGNLHYGDTFKTIARISKLPRLSNPEGFDFEEYLSSKGIYGQAVNLSNLEITGNKGSFLEKFIIKNRVIIRRAIDKAFKENSGFVKTMLMGEKQKDDPRQIPLQKAGLSHILAVSGLHVVVIAVCLMTILKIFIRKRKFARLAQIPILIYYAWLCSWSPSVARSVIMICLVMLSYAWERKNSTINALFASLFLITIVSPAQLFSIGLQMSFISVYALFTIVPEIKLFKKEAEIKKWQTFINYLIASIVVSVIMGVILSPLTLYYFNQTSLNGIVGNIIAIPVSSLMLPLIMIVLLFSPLTWLQHFLINSFNFLLLIFDKWCIMSANLPLYWEFGITSVTMLLSYLLIIIIVQLVRNRTTWTIYLPILLVVLTGMFYSHFTGHNSGKFKITFFDCGLGDLTLLETPDKKTIMIDCGPGEKASGHINNSAFPYLKEQGINYIDWLIITHAHNDHYGGIETLFSAYKINNLVINDDFAERDIWNYLQTKLDLRSTNISIIRDTCSLDMESIAFRIIHPVKEFENDNVNNMSIVVRCDYKDFSILLTGDLEEEGEHYLLENNSAYLDCDFLKIGHHGSISSSSPQFIDAVTPEYALIFTSQINRFNFPAPVTLTKLEERNCDYFISGFDGALQLVTDGQKAIFHSFLSQRKFTDYDLNE